MENSQELTMLYDRVLVLENVDQHDTFVKDQSGLFLSSEDDDSEDGLRRGKVIAIGPDCYAVKVGMEICWRKQQTGRPVNYNNLTHILLREDMIEGCYE